MPSGVYTHKKLSQEHKDKISASLRGKQGRMTGKKHSQATKDKMSEARKGKNHPMFGKKHKESSILKMSLQRIGKVQQQLVDYWKTHEQSEEHKAKSVKNLTHRIQKGDVGYWKGKKNPKIAGKNHWNYIDGRSENKQYISWVRNLHSTRKRNAKGSHTFAEWSELKELYCYTCPICFRKEPEIKLTKDHMIPLSKGGTDYITNIQPLCKSCNCKKSAKITEKTLMNIISLRQ